MRRRFTTDGLPDHGGKLVKPESFPLDQFSVTGTRPSIHYLKRYIENCRKQNLRRHLLHPERAPFRSAFPRP
jgi:hypothetical protein